MHGNVWEWCQDSYGPYSLTDITDPQSEDYKEDRVRRGGSWDYGAWICRAACRARGTPVTINDVGLRVCLRLD
jgi:formylglycine-generating enzyme required for sulfatase activity